MQSVSFEGDVWRAVKSKTYIQSEQPFDKNQSSKFCRAGVKETPFQNLTEKRKQFFDHSTTVVALNYTKTVVAKEAF